MNATYPGAGSSIEPRLRSAATGQGTKYEVSFLVCIKVCYEMDTV